MNRHSLRGNGNRAVWRELVIVDGQLYRLPNGELARASVVPHPDALPEYWEETPDGGDAWPTGSGLTLSLVWPYEAARSAVVGPAQLTLLTPACVAGVRWAEGCYVFDVDTTPEIVRKKGEEGFGPGWPLDALVPAGPEGEAEFDEAVNLASRAQDRLLAIRERAARYD
jgi:hypothetical protein